MARFRFYFHSFFEEQHMYMKNEFHLRNVEFSYKSERKKGIEAWRFKITLFFNIFNTHLEDDLQN